MTRFASFLAILAASLVLANASSQVPAGAPSGSTGVCKDGTYSNAAHKAGACSGHKGVQTWFSADAGTTTTTPKAAPQAAPAPPQAKTAPAPATATTTTPAPTQSTRNAPSQQAQAQAVGGGPGLVWVNTSTKVYHCPGTAYYGKTKAGKYLSEDAAKAEGDHADHGKTCAK